MTTTVSGSSTTSTGLGATSSNPIIVESGGTVVSTTVSSGGTLTVSSGGIDSGTLILAGGVETVSSGGSASTDNIFGTLTVISTGASAVSNETVEAGGVLNISKSATVSNTTMSGGTVDLLTGAATLAGSLTMAAGTTNTIDVTSLTNSVGVDGDLAVITGFTSGDKIDITAIASAAATLSQVVSGGNTVAEIVSGGTIVETFIFSGTAISGGLSLTADSGSHAELVVNSAVSSGGTTTSVTTFTASGAYTETSGNTLLVLSGGSVSAATIDNGGFLVVNGGTDTAAIISSGGSETVSTGSASGDAVYGVLSTVSGLAASLANDTVYQGGQIDLLNGGVATATTVLSGGELLISGAATATGVTLSGGGELALASPKATVSGSLVLSGSGDTIEVTGVASSGSGELAEISGFTASDTIDVTVISAGATLGFTSNGDGSETVTITGTSGTKAATESFTFASGSSYNAYTLSLKSDGGTGVDLVYNPSATTLTVSSGSTSTGLTVGSGETLLVQSGGTVSATTVANGGALVVSGTDHAATVSAGGSATVYGSATGDNISGTVTVSGMGAGVSGETIQSEGALIVIGGTDNAATVSAGGTETVNQGSASGDKIYGSVTVSGTGASVSSETVQSGGFVEINTGATDTSTTIFAGGNELVIGSASGDQIYGTQLVSAATAVVTGETVYNGGNLDLYLKGGIASGTVVSSGGSLNVSGAAFASNTVLSGGGILDLESPKADVTGSLTFAGGGNTLEITDTTSAGYGDLAVNSGFSSSDKIDLTSAAFVGSALTLSVGVTSGNTVAEVISGGTTVVETFTFAGTLPGALSLQSDGSGGVDLEIVPVSVTTSVTTPTTGSYTEDATDTLLVLNGGSVSSAVIDQGAFLIVNGGTDLAATIEAGGTETISAGSASGDQIFGSAIVTGGTVTNETVLSGGALNVSASGEVSDVVLSGGGLVDLASPAATLTGSLTFEGGGNTLQASAIASNGAGDQAAISGFSTSDKIDVTGISAIGATVTFSTNNSGQEVATVSGTGGSESFLFSNPAAYNASTMSLMSDGKGGVDLILDTTPVVTFTSLGGTTNQATDIVNGTVDTTVDPEAIGTTVSVLEGNTVVGTATVGANGYWSANVTFANTDGTNVLTATDTDGAGNTGKTSQSLTYSVNTSAAAFVPGNLVISISGDGDGSGSYGDNQASAITLEQITTTGTIVSQLVLPQTTTVVNGVTEYAISGEYGSSSEGALQLSADGHSLTIAGYGINAATYNAGGAAVYGNAALAQSTSVEGSQYTAVARVIADINADGVVDTSTALYDVFNENNPRSVATVDGSSFYISGQGLKGDTTQGVFLVEDGASTATSIDDATDTRQAEIYDGQLFVSVNSTQGGSDGTTNIASYGELPTSATTPMVLQGISNSVVLTAATANTVNTADIGSSVNLSPEAFFFANANTLYVADGGDPKEGGLGDGGLQKWVYNGSSWVLQYTLSAGLNLVPDTASSGTSGLIGLTGEVVGNTVELYATNETLTDLGQTYVYEITDSLSSTTGAGESFTQVLAASPDENIRGIAFAPTAATVTATVAQAFADIGNSEITTVNIVDTAANVAANIDTLNTDTQVASIAFTDTGTPTLTLTVAQALNDTTALGEITGSYGIAISDTAAAIIGNEVALLADTAITSVNVVDTAANVAANLDALNADPQITSITLTDTGTPTLTLSVAQVLDDTTALGEIVGSYTITVSDTASAILTNAAALSAISTITAVEVVDTAADVAAVLDALNADMQVTSITLTDTGTPTLTLTASQALGDTTALGTISGPYAIAISDTAVNVASALDALNADTHVTSITLTDSGVPTLTLTAVQALNDTTALGEITNANLAIAIVDTAANIAANLDALNADPLISSITLTGTGTPTLTVTAAQALSDTTALGEITNASDAVVVADTAANITADLDALNADPQITSITITNKNSLTLTTAQALGDTTALGEITNAGFGVTVADTAADVAASFDALNADPLLKSITLTDVSTLTLTAAQALDDTTALGEITNTGLGIAISDTATDVAGDLDALNADGLVKSIALNDDGTLTLTVAQALGDTTALGKITATGYAIAIVDTAANVVANLAALSADSHVTSILLTDGGTPALTLTISQALAGATALSEIIVPYTVTIEDTAANIAALTPIEVQALLAEGVNQIVATGAVTLTVSEAVALANDGIVITGASVAVAGTASAILGLSFLQDATIIGAGYTLEVVDTAADIEALTATQIAELGSLFVSKLVASNAGVALSVAQAAALEAAGIAVTTPTNTKAIVSDTAAHLEGLTAAEITGLAAIGVTGLASTNAGLVLTVAQALALESAGVKFTVPNRDTVTILDTAVDIAALTAAQIAALPAAGINVLAAINGNVTLSIAQALALEGASLKLTVPFGDKVTISDTAADIQALSTAQIAALAFAGFSGLTATNGNVTLSIAQATALENAGLSLSLPVNDSTILSDTAADLESLTVAQIADLSSLHVSKLVASNAGVVFSVAQAAALEAAGIAVATPTNTKAIVSDTAAHLEGLTATQIDGLAAIGVTGLASDNTNVSYTPAQTAAIQSLGLSVTAPGAATVTETFANGDNLVYSNGLLIQQKTVDTDGSYDIAYTNVTGRSYSSYETIFNGAGSLVAEAFDNASPQTSGSLSLLGSDLTVTAGAGTDSLTFGADSFALNPHQVESVTAFGATNDTFVYKPSFGQETLNGFIASGPGRDLLEFNTSSFGYLTPGMTQAADLAAVLSHATQTSAGNTVIADSLGDTLTLNAVTKATLSANPSAFKFV